MPLANGTPSPEPDEDRIRKNEKRYARLIERLDPDQALAVVDLVLDLRSPWIRRTILELPLVDGDAADRRALLSGLDAIAGSAGARQAA